MTTRKKFIMQGIVFSLIIALVFALLVWVFLPKAYFSHDWPDTSTLVNFYKVDRNSVDILFLGSSHCMAAFIPQVLYDQYKLTSYNLGTQQQNIMTSYFLLKEALRYQHPRAVVLDTYFCFNYPHTGNPLNSQEAMIRFAIDPMQWWSPVKWEAVSAICEIDEDQTVSSYYNPLERFHARWTSLSEDDFTFVERLSHDAMKGYAMLSARSGIEEFQPYEAGSSSAREAMDPLMEEYLDKIRKLCAEQSIDLILVNTPHTAADIERHNQIADYAAKYDLTFYDFNESTLYRDAGFDFPADTAEGSHLNYWGAEKITTELGTLMTDGGLTPSAAGHAQYEASRSSFEAAAQNAELRHISDLEAYLEAIDRNDYTVFIAVKDDASSSLSDAAAQALKDLGLETDLQDEYRSSFYAVISPEGVWEGASGGALSDAGTFRDGRSQYEISSAGYNSGNDCSIRIDGKEYARKSRGLNIVVYDNVYRKVIDSVVFDTFASPIEASR